MRPAGKGVWIHVNGSGAAWPDRRCACCVTVGPERHVTIEATCKASGPTGGAVYSSTITHTASASVPICSSCFGHQQAFHRTQSWGSTGFALAVIGVIVLDIWLMIAKRGELADLLGMAPRKVWMVVHPSAIALLAVLMVVVWMWKSSRLVDAQRKKGRNCAGLGRPVEYESLSVPVIGDKGDTSVADHVFWFANHEYARDFLMANTRAERLSGRQLRGGN